MTAFIHFVIGVLTVTRCSFSLNLNCTKRTTSCPAADQWLDRAKLFNCPGNRRYICLVASGNELREGCIFNLTIEAGRIGCPYTKECDIRTGQPLLVTPKNYLPCPPDLDGCPPRNHSGYSILEIYKYGRCQGRNSSDESSVSPDEVTIIPSKTPRHVNRTIIVISIAVAVSVLLIALIVCRIKHKNRSKSSMTLNHDSGKLRTKSSCHFTDDSESTLTQLLPSSSQQNCAIELHHSASSQTFYNPSSTVSDTLPHKDVSVGDIEKTKTRIDAKAGVSAKDGNTPFQRTVFNGYIIAVKIFIDAKADAIAKDPDGNKPLLNAASHGHIKLTKTLIEADADVNAKNEDENTPLHRAVSNGHSETVILLINAKVNVNVKDKCKDTPLHLAASNGHTDIVKILIDAKADVNAKGRYQDTSLHMAASNGHSNIVKLLIGAKADVNAQGWCKDTPLHLAASTGHTDIVKILIDAKADVNAKGRINNTPLHEAASCGHVEIIRILLSSEADFSIRNNNGETAEELGIPKSKQVFKVPYEIKELGADAIRQFLKSLNDDTVTANVVSCMFVAHIGVGKTTLVNNFSGLPRKKTKMTSCINVHKRNIFKNINTGEWNMKDERTEKMIGPKNFTQINVWEFAGKMMYYTMHLDHLSPRPLYVLVFNASLEMDGIAEDSVDPSDKGKRSVTEYLDFWVTTISTYVHSDVRGFPKFAIVGTHIDNLPDNSKISRIITEIKNKFQPLVDSGQLTVHEDFFVNTFDMNAETTWKLLDRVLECSKSYPEYRQIPRSWNDLHQMLILRKSENIINFSQLESMNRQMEKPLDEKELILCLEYFHSLGDLLFFVDDELKNRIILYPRVIISVMLSFITYSNKRWGVRKWQKMQNSGKIKHAYFNKALLESNIKARDGHHLHRVMKKLDLISEPKVYNAKGFEECQNYFYMPCIVNRDISSDALSLIENQEAVLLSFSFSTVIPTAVYNRLVASSLSLWPVFDSHYYNGLIILQSGPFHLVAFRRECKHIIMSVVHLEDQRHISVCLCRTIVQFVEQRLTWILSTYNTSTLQTKSLFHITYNSAAAESLKTRKIEEEDSKHCDDSCKIDVTQEASYVVDDLFLMRTTIEVNDIYPLAVKIYNHKKFADDLQSEYKELRKSDIAWLILMEWKRQVETKEDMPNLKNLRHILNESKINSHILCKVIRLRDEHTFLLDPAYLQTDVHSELLHAVADRISSEYIHVGLELGLNADAILKLLKKFKGRTVELIRAMLQDWYNKNRNAGHVKVVNLATALINAKCDISVLHEFEKLHDRNRQKEIRETANGYFMV